MHTWSLQDAKARFSELVHTAIREGAQIVTRHGKDVVAVVPYREYVELRDRRTGLRDFFARAPRVELDIQRDQSTGRDVDL
ncbi:MAG: type II toxin-antitoxin system Phd/YefM family antitoxin [bacterium]